MNMYEDFFKFIEENKSFLKSIEVYSPTLYVLFEDVLVVLDDIYKNYNDNSKIDEELKDFFEAGFGYITNVLSEIKMMYEDYFKSDIKLMDIYSSLIIYFFYVEDLKCHLDAIESLTDSKKKIIDDIQLEIETILQNKKPIDETLTEKYEVKISKITSAKDNFHPIYTIFSMIREELNLF
jgi:hypothetical protein